MPGRSPLGSAPGRPWGATGDRQGPSAAPRVDLGGSRGTVGRPGRDALWSREAIGIALKSFGLSGFGGRLERASRGRQSRAPCDQGQSRGIPVAPDGNALLAGISRGSLSGAPVAYAPVAGVARASHFRVCASGWGHSGEPIGRPDRVCASAWGHWAEPVGRPDHICAPGWGHSGKPVSRLPVWLGSLGEADRAPRSRLRLCLGRTVPLTHTWEGEKRR